MLPSRCWLSDIDCQPIQIVVSTHSWASKSPANSCPGKQFILRTIGLSLSNTIFHGCVRFRKDCFSVDLLPFYWNNLSPSSFQHRKVYQLSLTSATWMGFQHSKQHECGAFRIRLYWHSMLIHNRYLIVNIASVALDFLVDKIVR